MWSIYFSKKIALPIMLTILALGFGVLGCQAALAAEHPILYFFWGNGCPHCEKEQAFLKLLPQQYPTLEMRWFETWEHPEFANLLEALRKAFDPNYTSEKTAVPVTILGDQLLVGFRSNEVTGVQINAQVQACLQKGCADPLAKIAELPLVKKIRAEVAQQKADGWTWYPATGHE